MIDLNSIQLPQGFSWREYAGGQIFFSVYPESGEPSTSKLGILCENGEQVAVVTFDFADSHA